MKTTVEYHDGSTQEFPDAAPNLEIESEPAANTLTMIDAQCTVVSDDIPLIVVKRVIFEPEDA
jgi:hypothetical protein